MNRRYRDGLGFVYEVSPAALDAFEERRGRMLRVAIFIKLIFLAFLIWML